MPAPDLSVLLVHYHAPEDAAGAIESVAVEAEGSGLEVEVVLVDNGSTPEQAKRLAELPARRLEPGANLGYAGGLNLAATHAAAPLLAAMNPDVRLLPGCLRALAEQVAAGAAAAGPQFYLDREQRLLIPPTEERRPWPELLARLAERGARWSRPARRRWRRHARRHWQAAGPLASLSLSGALLVFARATWEATPFDAGYQLYFEEDDWLRRLARGGGETCYVPAARAVHLYNRSAAGEPRAGEWFAASRRRFERRWYGRTFALAARLATPGRPAITMPSARPLPPGRPRLTHLPRARPLWIELALSAKGFPAAAERLPAGGPESWSLPEDAWTALAPGTYLLQAVAERGDELARWSFTR